MDNVELCKKIRRNILTASYEAQACHVGSALSCVEILVDIFWNKLKSVEYEGYVSLKDIFIFSKASGACALYAVLAEKGYFPQDKIAYYLKNYPLPTKDVPGVQVSVGSLGHGLPIACGLAYADGSRDVYVLMSDGELDEGTSYESALFARQYKLDNLYVVVDFNSWQACGRTKDVLDLTTAIEFFKKTLPHLEVVKTIKGDGVSFMRDDNLWHYKNLSLDEYNQAIKELQ